MRLNHRIVLGGALALIATAGLAKRDRLEELPPAPMVETPQPYQPVRQDQVNYDEVGYSGRFEAGGVAIAHETLPVGSFAEVTNLSTGNTILTKVVAVGPVGPGRIVAMTPGAAAQLGMEVMTPGVRVRRTNPPEHERTALANGGQVAERLETPPALLNALRKKLSAPPVVVAVKPAAPVIAARPVRSKRIAPAPPMRAGADFAVPDAAAAVADAEAAAPMPAPPPRDDDRFVEEESRPHWTVGSAPEPGQPPKRPAPPAKVAQPAPVKGSGDWYVQVGAFASAANARATATRAGGGVVQAGSLYRVRTGPYASEGAARAALGPLAAKGYRGARITR